MTLTSVKITNILPQKILDNLFSLVIFGQPLETQINILSDLANLANTLKIL